VNQVRVGAKRQSRPNRKEVSEWARASSEQVVREIHRRTRRRFSAEEKVRIVLDGLRGEQSVAELCRREGLARMGGDDRSALKV
jgi:transposase